MQMRAAGEAQNAVPELAKAWKAKPDDPTGLLKGAGWYECGPGAGGMIEAL